MKTEMWQRARDRQTDGQTDRKQRWRPVNRVKKVEKVVFLQETVRGRVGSKEKLM